jgi:Methylase involved in ubiquinone/menaquinone biosynthesis
MVAIARRKGLRDVVVADALRLPFAAQSFDVVTVAFGLRNMRDWSGGLREMRRVLTSSGRLLILDFSLPRNALLRKTYGFYLHQILPLFCRLITSEKEAYEYLGTSIETFPNGSEMCRLIESNGFSRATAEPLTGGIVTIYTAAAGSIS